MATQGLFRALAGNLARDPVRGVNRPIGIGHPGGVRAGKMDASKPRAACLDLAIRLRVKQRVGLVRIAMAPAIDGDGSDVPIGIEAARTQDSAELIASVRL